MGLDHGYGWNDDVVGTSTPQDDDFGIGGVFTSFNYDTFDDLGFPKTGTRGGAEYRRSTRTLGGEEDFNRTTARLATAYTWDRNTLVAGGQSGFTGDGSGSVQDLYNLGGLFNLSGLLTDQLTGQNFAIGELIFYRKIAQQSGLIKIPVYLGASLEAGNVWADRDDMDLDDLVIAGSAFLGVDTPFGPIYLAYGHAEGGNNAVYFFLGQTF